MEQSNSPYGTAGPPAGYSTPRGGSSASPFCQHCQSTDHWTYACKASSETTKKKSAGTPRLSASQLLRLGLKRKRVEVVPVLSEKEAFDQNLKSLERELVESVKKEKHRLKEAKSEQESGHVEEEDPTAR